MRWSCQGLRSSGSSSSIGVLHNHHFGCSDPAIRYLCVSLPPAVKTSLIEQRTWDL